MGLDIGMVDRIEWTPRPGWEFWERLSHYAVDADGNRLTLDDVRDAFECMSEDGSADADDIERAREFVKWCEAYWDKRGYGADDCVSIVLSY